jgi:hypothetical protein
MGEGHHKIDGLQLLSCPIGGSQESGCAGWLHSSFLAVLRRLEAPIC